MRPDPFAVVLGTGRGKQESDTLLSPRPSPSGRAELEEHLQLLREHEFDHAMAVLSANYALIGERPLLGELAFEVCKHLVGQSSAKLDEALRHALDKTGVYPALSDYLVLGPETKTKDPIPRSQRLVHIWPEGDRVGPIACLEEPSPTVCGQKVDRGSWQRVQRGTWTSDSLADIRWSRCEECEENCPDDLAYILEEKHRYVPFGGRLYAKTLKTVMELTLKRMSVEGFDSVEDAGMLANRCYQSLMLPSMVACAQRAQERAVQWMLGRRTWREMRRHAPDGELFRLLTATDWKEALEPCVPALDGDDVREASEEQYEAARALIERRLRERIS